jgi:hypothetical protein
MGSVQASYEPPLQALGEGLLQIPAEWFVWLAFRPNALQEVPCFQDLFLLFFIPQKGYALSSASSYAVLCRPTDRALLDHERLIEPHTEVQGSLSASKVVFTFIFRI